ncbi:hypothetical protein D7B24_001815 [Verticillium nonalfalfae]|uniref:Uncharacterized protein n=1 Tax=Verticillium nonalfalfae TaxID=1051616 RepID=A0A3M9YGR4_9PEZI|nr:uncharacterized protein D7B24_001815 [Verticillium nonalfalfae]RNJ59639.1 hypothetical protein D7B24_001815 [Verticillium nonalfalfae]
MPANDSPLSIAANVAGIVTLVFAVLAAVYARISYLRNSDDEYFRVKASLSWYKTESTWLVELIRAVGGDSALGDRPAYQMYSFVMDDLVKLEQRILELVAETEERALAGAKAEDSGWTLIPRRWAFTTTVAMAWLPVRTKALALVRQRDALTARVQFTQMSMISSRIRDLERKTQWKEARTEKSFLRMQADMAEQRAQIHRLEDLVYRMMHRDRVRPREEQSLADAIQRRPSRPSSASPPRGPRRPSGSLLTRSRSR